MGVSSAVSSIYNTTNIYKEEIRLLGVRSHIMQ